jgi:hypothetical protein
MQPYSRRNQSTYMGGLEENIGQPFTRLITLLNCVRGIRQDKGSMVRQGLYRMNRISLRKLVLRMGLVWDWLLTLGEPMSKRSLHNFTIDFNLKPN